MTPQSSPATAVGAAPTLRPYQHGIVGGVLGQLEIVRSTLAVAATGTGKTVCFAELARIIVQRGGRALILVHRDELISQARRKCEAIGLWPDVEKGKQRANTLARVVLASVQSLKGARLQRWAADHFALVIVDEAHHAVAASYRTILDHFTGAKVVGVTATPDRADGQGLDEVYESVAYRYEIRQAIDEGYLVPIVARRIVVESVDLSTVATRAGDFAQDQLADAMSDERALQGTARPLLELARDRSTIAFCVDVAHAEALARTLNSYRPGCARAVSGRTDEDERTAMLEAHARGEFQFLTNCDVLTEGYDAPSCSCVAMCRPTKSRGRFVQAAGRGLRPHPESGKRDCLILDFTGTAGKHSLIGPADCLAAAGEIPDDVRAEIERLTETAQLEIDAVIAQATELAASRRAQLRLSAVVRWHEERIDPFVGSTSDVPLPQREPGWAESPASTSQLDALKELGIDLDKLPPGFSRGDAWRLLVRLKGRKQAGWCSYKMARLLGKYGVDTLTLSQARAVELQRKLQMANYRPEAIAREPEMRRAKEVA